MIIGIPTNNTGRKSDTPGRSQNAAYVKYVDDAGFTPVLIPMEADPSEISAVCDALLLAGGIDIDPIYYGVSNTASYSVDPEKDRAERNLFHAFRELGKPIFGICRGFQLIVREYMHTRITPHLKYIEHIGNHGQTSNLSMRRDIPSHLVRCKKRSLYSEDLNCSELEVLPVNSMHHQALAVNHVKAAYTYDESLRETSAADLSDEPKVHRMGDIELLAWSMRGINQPGSATSLDYMNYWAVVEAVRIYNWSAPIMGTQWHPEELRDVPLFRNFILSNTQNDSVDSESYHAVT